jgi:hypothetical protein
MPPCPTPRLPALYARLGESTPERGTAAVSDPHRRRPTEAREARWREVAGDVWTIPPERMKEGREHRVPLSPRRWRCWMRSARWRSGRALRGVPAVGHGAGGVLRAVVVLGDVGAVTEANGHSMPLSCIPRSMCSHGMRVALGEAVPGSSIRARQGSASTARTRPSSRCRPSATRRQAAAAGDRLVHVPDRRAALAVRPFADERVLLLRAGVDHVGDHRPGRRIVEPAVAPVVVAGQSVGLPLVNLEKAPLSSITDCPISWTVSTCSAGRGTRRSTCRRGCRAPPSA